MKATIRTMLASALLGTLVACGEGNPPSAAPGPGSDQIVGSGPVVVAYAGTLAGAFERHLAPAYDRATGFRFQGEAKGSVALANLIRDRVRTPDVFISADPAVNLALAGPSNGNFVSWWADFATSEMVIAWSPASRFAGEFRQASRGGASWESVLSEPGLRLGRTDPEIDPKGYRTLWLFQLDQERTRDPSLSSRILGAATNPAQIFLEEQLVTRLQAGELDAGIFFKVEAVAAGLPFLSLPREINQADVAHPELYSRATYTTRRGVIRTGAPIVYTVTIPSTARNRRGALALCQYLLSPPGQKVLSQQGLGRTPPLLHGDTSAVPAELAGHTRPAP